MGDLISILREDWAVIAQAPLAFMIWTIVLAALLWGLVSWAKANQIGDLQSRLALRDDRIAEYERKLDGASPEQAHERIERLEARIEQMESDPLAGMRGPDGLIVFDGGNAGLPRKELPDPRDPDRVYQHGRAVGTVVSAEVIPGLGIARFGAINDAIDLDKSRPFEYRNWVLSFDRADIIGNHSIGGVEFCNLRAVTCKIIGPRG